MLRSLLGVRAGVTCPGVTDFLVTALLADLSLDWRLELFLRDLDIDELVPSESSSLTSPWKVNADSPLPNCFVPLRIG